MTLIDYDQLGSQHAAARRGTSRAPGLLLDLETFGDARVAERFVGITTDGVVVPGLFLSERPEWTRLRSSRRRTFLDSLDGAPVEACLPIDSEHWRTWCNVHIYMWRHGVLLEDLSASQRDAGLAHPIEPQHAGSPMSAT
jgi:hypothetical protein